MNVQVLIDAIIHQTMVLVANLATNAGVRAPLAQIGDRAFIDLVGELEARGLSRKVIADMFGLALRSYQLKVQRLQESILEDTHTLWEQIYEFVPDDELLPRRDIVDKFRFADEAVIRSILNDLVESGLVMKTGRGRGTRYRRITDDELGRSRNDDPVGTARAVTWITVYRNRRITREQLAEAISLPDDDVEIALADLVTEGRITRVDKPDHVLYESPLCVIPMGHGWEAAVFDHFQSVVSALTTKLEQGRNQSLPSDVVGGSTYSFDVWEGHPHRERVMGLLSSIRGQISEIRAEVTAYNSTAQRPDEHEKVTFYLGQAVSLPEEPRNDDDED